jgi:hypothetical protein
MRENEKKPSLPNIICHYFCPMLTAGPEFWGHSVCVCDAPTISNTCLNPVPNAQVCVYLMVHITKLQFQNLFIYDIPHVSIRTLAAENLDVCTACDP